MWTLLVVDLALLALHMAMTGFSLMDTAPDTVNWARIDRDESISEFVELLMLLSAAAMLILRALIDRRTILLPIAATLAYLGADDKLGLHENLATVILPGHQNYGELLYFVILFCVTAAISVVAWIYATTQERSFLLAIWIGIGVLGGFGVGFDALDVEAYRWFIQAQRTISVVEDWGELLAISMIAGTCYLFFRSALKTRWPSERLSPG